MPPLADDVIGHGDDGCTRCGLEIGLHYLPHDDPSEFVCTGCLRDGETV